MIYSVCVRHFSIQLLPYEVVLFQQRILAHAFVSPKPLKHIYPYALPILSHNMKHYWQRDEHIGIQESESDTIELEIKHTCGCLMKTKKLQWTVDGHQTQ